MSGPHHTKLYRRFRALNAATSRIAAILAARGVRVSLGKLVFAPCGVFVRRYLRKGQWRQGAEGFVLASFSAYAVFICYTKLWEIQTGVSSAPPPAAGNTSSSPTLKSSS